MLDDGYEIIAKNKGVSIVRRSGSKERHMKMLDEFLNSEDKDWAIKYSKDKPSIQTVRTTLQSIVRKEPKYKDSVKVVVGIKDKVIYFMKLEDESKKKK